MEKAIIITAPSGAGKTTLVKMLLEERKDLSFSVSACTRKKREKEIDGKDYYFLSTEEFEKNITADKFLEYEEVYGGMFYGTLESEVERIWEEDKSVLFDIDVQGAVSLKDKLGDKALSIFIQPPSIETLVERLTDRKTENADTIAMRVSKAEYEMQFQEHMDAVIINDKLDLAFKELNEKVQSFLYSS